MMAVDVPELVVINSTSDIQRATLQISRIEKVLREHCKQQK